MSTRIAPSLKRSDRSPVAEPAAIAERKNGPPAPSGATAPAAVGARSREPALPAAAADRAAQEAAQRRAPAVPQTVAMSLGRAPEGLEHAADAAAHQVVGPGTIPGAHDAASGAKRPVPIARARAGLGAGAPLDPAARGEMEAAFGHDFGGVRVHTDEKAAAAAGSMGAVAFTSGQDIAFGRGEHRPGSPEGKRLIAHELTHVVQQREGAEPRVAMRPKKFAATPEGGVRAAVQGAFESMARSGAEGGFGAALAEAAQGATGADVTAEQKAEIGARAAEVGDIEQQLDPTTSISIPGAFKRLHDLAAVGEGDELAAVTSTLGGDYVLDQMAQDAAGYIAWPVSSPDWSPSEPKGGLFSPAAVRFDLNAVVEATKNPERLMQLELEAAVLELIAQREAFKAADARGSDGKLIDPKARAAAGAAIGKLARRALLLDKGLVAVQTSPGPATPIEQQMTKWAGEIARIRGLAAAEHKTRDELGDRPELLTQQNVVFPGQILQVPAELTGGAEAKVTVDPEEALPATTDAATVGLLQGVAQQAKQQAKEIDALHDDVVPRAPTYELAEFVQVYRRWFAFVSPAQDLQNPVVRLILSMFDRGAQMPPGSAELDKEQRDAIYKKLRSPYELMGMASEGGPVSSVSAGVARAMMNKLAADMLARELTGPTSDFSGSVHGAPLGAGKSAVGGRASKPVYRFGQMYGAPGGPFPSEGASRDAMLAAQQQATSERFSQVANNPTNPAMPEAGAIDLARIQGPAAAKAPNPGAPLLGMRETPAKAGWSYLVDVTDPTGEEVLAREHKVMPPEVARYLLAKRQQIAALRTTHKPKADDKPIGDERVRKGGLEEATGTSAAKYAGVDGPAPSKDAVDAKKSLASMRSETGASGRDSPEELGRKATDDLALELGAYLDAFFHARTGGEYRIAAVLAVADIEHGTASKFEKSLSAEELLEAAGKAMGWTAILFTLNKLGPIGRVAGMGVEAWLKTQGVSDVTLLMGVADFLRQASKVSSLGEARAWGYVAPNFTEALAQLVHSAVSRAAAKATGFGLNKAYDAFSRAKPSTPKQLADMARPLMADPKARAAMLAALEAELSAARDPGAKSGLDRNDLAQLEAFKAALVGSKLSPEAAKAANEALKGTPMPKEATALFGGAVRPRDAKDRAKLEAAIPPELRGRVRVIENPLLVGTTVLVTRGAGGRVRIECGPEATEVHVRLHVETAREQAAYQGVRGRVRELAERVGDALRLTPPSAQTKGGEATREIEKLKRIHDYLHVELTRIDTRAREIESSGRPPTAAERAAVEREIKSIERQMKEHLKNIGSYEKGRGFIAAVDNVAQIQGALTRAGHGALAAALIRGARTPQELDALGDLAENGGIERLIAGGVPPEQVLPILQSRGFGATHALSNDVTDLSTALGARGGAAVVQKNFKPTKIQKSTERLADMAERARTAPPEMLAPDPFEPGKAPVVLDSNVLIPHETPGGTAVSDVNARAYVGGLANADVRVPLPVHAEVRAVAGQDRKGVPLEPGVDRNHPDFLAAQRALEAQHVGRDAKGGVDRAIVTEVLFAKTGVDAAGVRQPATLVTADVDMYTRLAAMSPATRAALGADQKWRVPGSAVGFDTAAEAVAKAYGPGGSNGFEVTVTIAPGKTRTMRVVPIPGT